LNKKRIEKMLPSEHKNKIFDIDYQKYFDLGYRTLFFDLDNTIADYDTHKPSYQTMTLFRKLKKQGFNIVILSNNKGKRVDKFSKALSVEAYSNLMKPLTFRLKRNIKMDQLDNSKIIWIGDQVVTDIKLASKLGIKSILVDPINMDSEKWYTTYFNRRFEKRRLNDMKKHCNTEYKALKLENR